MNRIKSAGQTLYNHKKKAIFAAIVLAYGADYGRLAVRDANIRTYYAKEALKFGEQTISAEHQPRRITVLINKSADSGSAVSNFKKNALPLLNLSGIAITVINTEDAKQMTSLCAVLDSQEADGIFVVGGDGTANNAITGIMERKGLNEIPIGFFPGGKCNKALRLLIPSIFQHTDDVRYQCESAMAVIEETRAKVKPLKCEMITTVLQEVEAEDGTKNNIEQIKEESVWTLGDISAGWFSYIEDKKWKRWYWGSLKRRFAYFWEMVKNSPHLLRTEVSLTDYCSGCSRCRITTEAPKIVEWKWWHLLIGTPKPKRQLGGTGGYASSYF
uniref:DAGKc domain-containing protein n=1 Tax=Panagrolaimus sp. PS1159 TaxID=55785 RepID=A0AC35GH44_9BILA